jgi:hypothetical protein
LLPLNALGFYMHLLDEQPPCAHHLVTLTCD